MRTPDEAAAFMLTQYGSKKRAMEFAIDHKHQYEVDDPRYTYWDEVCKELEKL